MRDPGRGSLEKTLLILASVVFVGLGALRALYPHNDFTQVYAGAHCLLDGCDPYQGTWLVYPPSMLVVGFPLALFSYRMAWLLWLAINAALFIVAANLVVTLCPPTRRRLAAILSAIILAGSSQLLAVAQPSAPAIALATIGGYCLISGRMRWGGIAALILSLAIKPQIAGLLALYWAVRGPHRRDAIAAIFGSVVLLACGILIVQSRHEGARWVNSMRANIASEETSGAIGTGDVSQASATLSLQAVTSVFSQTGKIYNRAAYVIFGILLAAWLTAEMKLMQLKADSARDLLSMGGLAVLTLLPVYHRSYDSRLLMLAIPAALIVLERRRVEGILLCILVASSVVSIQHWLQLWLGRIGLLDSVLHNHVLLIFLLRESVLRLLACFGLLLFALARWNAGSELRPEGDVRMDASQIVSS